MTALIPTLQSLGYTEREAAFLYLVANHSGYFLRRQFNYYIDRGKGFLAQRFLEKAQEAGHVETIEHGHGFHVYHLFAKPIYRLLGTPDSQNRRRKGHGMVRARLMTLDYVLQNDDCHYLVSDDERVAFFHEVRRVPMDCLPGGPLFSSVFPIAISEREHPSTSLVRFIFIDEGLLSIRKYSRFLTEMAPLWRELGTFELVYAACSDCNFQAADREFRRQFSPIVPAQQRSLRPDWQANRSINHQRRPPLNAWFTTVLFEHSYPRIQRSEARGSVHESEDGSDRLEGSL
jgi:hypothetical protein